MRHLSKYLLALAVGAFLASGIAATAFAQESNVTFQNGSSFAIAQLFLSPTAESLWGPDQLGADVLESGSAVMLTGIECSVFDLKLVDEDGDECVVNAITLCDEDSVWDLTDEALLGCEFATAVEGGVDADEDEEVYDEEENDEEETE